MKSSWYGIFVVLFIACSFSGCRSAEEAEPQEVQQIALTDELTISADTDDALIGTFAGLTASPGGFIYAVDDQQQTVHVFAP